MYYNIKNNYKSQAKKLIMSLKTKFNFFITINLISFIYNFTNLLLTIYNLKIHYFIIIELLFKFLLELLY